MRAGFLAILALVFALTGYVSWHLWRIAPPGWKLAVTGLFLLWMASMFAGFAYTERVPVKLATVLYEVGNTWMIAFLYLLLGPWGSLKLPGPGDAYRSSPSWLARPRLGL